MNLIYESTARTIRRNVCFPVVVLHLKIIINFFLFVSLLCNAIASNRVVVELDYIIKTNKCTNLNFE